MCGVFVVINKKSKPVNLKNCISALNKMKKRGPDWDFYRLIAPNFFMGQVVLSMTGKTNKDINQHFSHDKKKFILFNGEIYNYKELSKRYQNSKIQNEISDTNVLVNLINKIGFENINKVLDGMYAFIVYDKVKKQIIINRDPQGEKILYVFSDDNEIILSSEINAIIHYKKNIKLNINILKNYFYTRHFTQFDKSIFKNIRILEPGHLKTLDLNTFKFKLHSKFSLNNMINEIEYDRNNKRKIDDLADELDFLLNKNVKEMIPKKRKFASVVSGGIDSSLISHYVCKNSKPTNLICLNHVGKDKLTESIRLFEQKLKFKISHHKIYERDYYENLLDALRICNGPINSHSFVGQLIVSRFVNRIGCKGLFVGEGADELFGGYDTYKQKIFNPKINQSNYTKLINSNLFKKDQEYFDFKKNLNNHWKDSLNKYSFIKDENQRNRLAMMLMDATVQLSSNGLRGADLMGMNFSVEARTVFLRRDIVKFALNLPLKFKINFNNDNLLSTKVLLKKVFLKYFPKKLVFKKQGFAGFPNETSKYLKNKNDYQLKNIYKIKNYQKKINKLDRAGKWKLINTEMYLVKIFNQFRKKY